MARLNKVLTTVLDILLLIGALTAVMTINGGRWMSGFTNSQAIESPRYGTIPVTGGYSINAAPGVLPTCAPVWSPGMPYWYESNQLRSTTGQGVNCK